MVSVKYESNVTWEKDIIEWQCKHSDISKDIAASWNGDILTKMKCVVKVCFQDIFITDYCAFVAQI